MFTENNELKAMADALNGLNRIMLNKAVRDRFQIDELVEDMLVGKLHVLKKDLYITESYTDNFPLIPHFTFQVSLNILEKTIVVISSELPVPTNVEVVTWNTELVKTFYPNGYPIAIDRILIEKFCLQRSK